MTSSSESMRDSVATAGSATGDSSIGETQAFSTAGSFLTRLRPGELTAFLAFDVFPSDVALLLLLLVIVPGFLFILDSCSRQKEEARPRADLER
jgi:hypothetical protein